MQVKLSFFLLAGSIGALLSSSASAEVSFEKQVKPVLESACLSCHGEKKPKENISNIVMSVFSINGEMMEEIDKKIVICFIQFNRLMGEYGTKGFYMQTTYFRI